MKLSDAARIVKGTKYGNDVQFDEVSTDTRTLDKAKNALFFALRGENFDGHDYIDRAKQAGAVAVVVSQQIEIDLPSIKVADVHQALIDLAQYHREQMNCTVIAVTGSCGKTTTRALLASVFGRIGKTLASEKSFNNDIGVPITLLRITPEHQYVICELGANHPGEIAKLTHIVKPNIAIITNAAAAHLEGFENLHGVACAKGEIFQGLNKTSGVAIINQDEQFAPFWKKRVGKHRIVTFGINNTADVQAQKITFNSQSQPNFLLKIADDEVAVQLQLIGRHNVANALAAAAAAYALGIPSNEIASGLSSCFAVNERLVEKKGLAGATIIDDSYNANPLSVTAAMQVLTSRTGDSVLVLGDMLELGKNTSQLHHDLGERAAHLGINKLFCYGKLTRNTVNAFGDNAYFFETQEALITALKEILHADMNVLVKGSAAMKMSQIVAALTPSSASKKSVDSAGS